ncbi:MAG: ATP-binding cassette domain-containing protein, partial [Synergistaceae bacterium]
MLDFSNLTVKYKNSETLAVSDVSFSLNDGEFVGVVGESGSGKTSVISAAMGLLPVGATVTGSIYFKGRDLLALPPLLLNKIRWNEIALIPQGALNSFTPVLTIGHHI